jgi:5-methylthioadenosine/S-adenosylhomocysteine deaminase
MRLAALLAKLQSGDAAAMPAHAALAMATINGARAMGIDHKVGSLEVGKQADIIALDMNQPETLPLYNPLSQLVYACSANQLSHSWINGKLVVNEGVVPGVDLKALGHSIQKWQHRISG